MGTRSLRWSAVSSLVLVACGQATPGAGSLAELESELRAALMAKDEAAFARLVLTAEYLQAKCPGAFAAPGDDAKLAAERGAFVADARGRFLACAGYDWAEARELEDHRRDPKLGERSERCVGDSARGGTFETRFALGAMEVFLTYRASKIDGRFFVSDDFMCVRD